METAKQEFAAYLREFEFAAPRIPVIANVTARPYEQSAIADGLSKQISSTVLWSESIQYLMALATHRGESATFEEVGHGDVLTRIHQTIKRQTTEEALAKFLGEWRPAGRAASRTPDPTEKVTDWNRKHSVGTRVQSSLMSGQLETRTPAMVLFGHRAAVYLKGYNGYFDLDELVALRAG
jgi:acyl transferase domain-containing protein